MSFCTNCGYESAAYICPICGGGVENDPSGALDALKPGTPLSGGAFRVGRLLKSGPCLVYLGCNQNKQCLVVIKEAFGQGARRNGRTVVAAARNTEEARAALDRSCRLQGRVRHPSVPECLMWFEENETLYAVFEYRPGKTLRDAIEAHGALPESQAAALALRMAESLEAVHEAELVHRDINPSNFLVDGDITDKAGLFGVSLVDFGEAADIAPLPPYATADLVWDRRRGTPGYAPPEQYDSRTSPRPSADIYGLGATLYFLLTGHDPPDAPARSQDDQLIPLLAMNAPGTGQQMQASIAASCAIDSGYRPDIRNLIGLLSTPIPAPAPVVSPNIVNPPPSLPHVPDPDVPPVGFWDMVFLVLEEIERNRLKALAWVVGFVLLLGISIQLSRPSKTTRQRKAAYIRRVLVQRQADVEAERRRAAAIDARRQSASAYQNAQTVLMGTWLGTYDGTPAVFAVRPGSSGLVGNLTSLCPMGFYQISARVDLADDCRSITVTQSAVTLSPAGGQWNLGQDIGQLRSSLEPGHMYGGTGHMFDGLNTIEGTGRDAVKTYQWSFNKLARSPVEVDLGGGPTDKAPRLQGRWYAWLGGREVTLDVTRQIGDGFEADLTVPEAQPTPSTAPGQFAFPMVRPVVGPQIIGVLGLAVPDKGRILMLETGVKRAWNPIWKLGSMSGECYPGLGTMRVARAEGQGVGAEVIWTRNRTGPPAPLPVSVPASAPDNTWHSADVLAGITGKSSNGGLWYGPVRYLSFGDSDAGRTFVAETSSQSTLLRLELWEGSIAKDNHAWWNNGRKQVAVSTGSEEQPSLETDPRLEWTIQPGTYTLFFAREEQSGSPVSYPLSYRMSIGQ